MGDRGAVPWQREAVTGDHGIEWLAFGRNPGGDGVENAKIGGRLLRGPLFGNGVMA